MGFAWLFSYFLIAGAAMLTAALLVPLSRRLAWRWGLVALPHPDKAAIRPTPLLGGLAIVGAFTVTVLAAYLLVLAVARDGGFQAAVPAQVLRYAPGMFAQRWRLAAILVGGLGIFAIGCVDDKRSLRPITKLLLEGILATTLSLSGIRLSLFIESELITTIITVLWILTIINAFNFMDNMDGLAGGVAAIAGFFFLLTAIQYEQFFVSAMLAAITGAVLGFLFYNLHPASIFMGDAGSLFLGYILSILTILGTYHRSGTPTVFPIVVPLVILAIPLYEVVTVTTIRLRVGLSPFKASKHHLSFRMRGLGLTVPGAVGFIYLMTACSGLAALLLPQLNTVGAIIDLLLVGTILAIVALFEYWGGRLSR
jgi:UDP-GlcNAc:undecaprenyl-phosphate GlcNAc-1-phosphate transferase